VKHDGAVVLMYEACSKAARVKPNFEPNNYSSPCALRVNYRDYMSTTISAGVGYHPYFFAFYLSDPY